MLWHIDDLHSLLNEGAAKQRDAQSAGNGIADSDVNFNEALKLDEVLK